MFGRARVADPLALPDCLEIDILRPREEVDWLPDFWPFPLMLTKGCTGFSCPGEGPVDRIKSAKSRIDSDSILGSLASGLVTTLRLGEGLCWAVVGPFALGAVVLGRFAVPKDLSSALARGYTVTDDSDGLRGSALFKTGDSYQTV
jgi:hypothetical protein